MYVYLLCLLLFQRNTFQLVITSDGDQTFALLIYGQLEWSNGAVVRESAVFCYIAQFLTSFHVFVLQFPVRIKQWRRYTGKISGAATGIKRTLYISTDPQYRIYLSKSKNNESVKI